VQTPKDEWGLMRSGESLPPARAIQPFGHRLR